MYIIGITGPTGAGKTTALDEVLALGGKVIDCDAVYHTLLQENLALREKLTNRFGNLNDEAGQFDRKKLGSLVFGNPPALQDLSDITFPFVFQRVKTLLAQAEQEGCPLVAVDAIRLLESGLSCLCHFTVCILAPQEFRLARIISRDGISKQYAQSRIAAQKDDDFYRNGCDYTLYNNGTKEQFAAKANDLFESLLHGRGTLSPQF